MVFICSRCCVLDDVFITVVFICLRCCVLGDVFITVVLYVYGVVF